MFLRHIKPQKRLDVGQNRPKLTKKLKKFAILLFLLFFCNPVCIFPLISLPVFPLLVKFFTFPLEFSKIYSHDLHISIFFCIFALLLIKHIHPLCPRDCRSTIVKP